MFLFLTGLRGMSNIFICQHTKICKALSSFEFRRHDYKTFKHGLQQTAKFWLEMWVVPLIKDKYIFISIYKRSG